MTKLHCSKALDMRHNGERGAHESRKKTTFPTRVKHKKASNRSCFVIFLSFVSPILSIHTEYQIETNAKRTNGKKLSSKKKKKSFVTSVYCVLDNLKNFPRCVFFSNISGAQVFTIDFFNES